jgi:RNA polymerase sigma-70 factor (sigma-E family)
MSHDSLRPASYRPGPPQDALAGYTVFFEREFPRVVRSVYLIVRDVGRAEELSQEAFIQLFKHWKKVSGYERPEAWVRRVAIRLSTRSSHRERLRSVLERQTMTPTYDTETPVDLLQALHQLTVNQRAAIVLHYYEDRPVQEVAEILDCSENTVKSHLRRGRSSLRVLLADESRGSDVD